MRVLLLLLCGNPPAGEGGLTADHSLTDVPGPTVGASLLAKAVFQAPSISNRQ